MTNPLLYDFRRTLTSKSVIIIMLLPILISLAIIPSLTIITGLSNSPRLSLLGYHDSDGYHFIMYASNQFGQGVSGFTADLNLTLPNKVYSGSASTNSSGFATILIAAPPNANYTVMERIISPSGFSLTSGGGYTPFLQYINMTSTQAIPDGQMVNIISTGQYPIGTVTDSSNSSVNDISVFYVAPFGKPPTDYSVYYKLFNQTEGQIIVPFNTYNQSQMQILGSLTGYVSTFPPPILPANYTQNSYFIFELFYPNGTATGPGQLITASQLYIPQTPIQTTSLVSAFFTTIFAIFIPLMAIIGSYNSYGKDRVTGVLESVLCRPVTRRGLAISRFLSIFSAMAVAIIVAMAAIDGLVYFFSHSFIDVTLLLASTGGFLVELAAFVGIMLLLSHLVKSSGALIGAGIGLFIILDLFWSVIVVLVASIFHTSIGSLAYYQFSILMSFINPAQFVSLVNTYLTGQSGFGPITPSQYGIAIPTLVGAAVLWIAVPFVIYVFLAIKRD